MADALEVSAGTERKAEFLAKIESLPAQASAATMALRYEPGDLASGMRLSEVIARSGLCPEALRNKPNDVLIILMRGAEFGLTAMQSLNNIDVVQGRPTMRADLIVGLVKASGKALYFSLVETTQERATYETHRAGDPAPIRMSFDMAQAARMGLANKDNWKKNAEAMLRARCKSALARAVYEDVVGGLYSAEEIMDLPPQPPRFGVIDLPKDRVAQATSAPQEPAKVLTVVPSADQYIDHRLAQEIEDRAADLGVTPMALEEFLVVKVHGVTKLTEVPVSKLHIVTDWLDTLKAEA